MKTYIVRVKDPSVRKELEKNFEKVGKPKAIHKTILVETDKSKSEIEKVDGVIKVQEDLEIKFSEQQEEYIQKDPKGWALPRICGDTTDEENGKYVYKRTGKNVDIYIIDTGILSEHEDFIDENGETRVEHVYTPNDDEIDDDYSGPKYHGTAVASCAAGKICGVAKEASIKNVRIFGTGASTVKGMDKVLEHHNNKNNSNPSIANMSFVSPSVSDYLEEETKDLVENGIICVGGAGNEGDKGALAPSSHSHVISVGATDKSNNMASYSNYGKSVDILAPGSNVLTARIDSKDSYNEYSYGTSFSTPYVSGVCALIVEDSIIKKEESVNKVREILIKNSKSNVMQKDGLKGDTPNRFIYSLVDNNPIIDKEDKKDKDKKEKEDNGDNKNFFDKYKKYIIIGGALIIMAGIVAINYFFY